MVKIYTTTIDYLDNDDVFEAEYNIVPAYRKQKIDALKSDKERKRSLAAERLLMKALQENDVEYDGSIVVGPHGKPRLNDNDKLFYNLSHSGNRVLCVVADSEVGCDIEKIERVNDKIAKRFFSENENKMIDAIEDKELKETARARLWCLRESFGKMTGLGLGAIMDKARFEVGNISQSGKIQGGEYRCWENDGYCYAYCQKK